MVILVFSAVASRPQTNGIPCPTATWLQRRKTKLARKQQVWTTRSYLCIWKERRRSYQRIDDDLHTTATDYATKGSRRGCAICEPLDEQSLVVRLNPIKFKMSGDQGILAEVGHSGAEGRQAAPEMY
jgi:hypothetical protein